VTIEQRLLELTSLLRAAEEGRDEYAHQLAEAQTAMARASLTKPQAQQATLKVTVNRDPGGRRPRSDRRSGLDRRRVSIPVAGDQKAPA
jgi:hypothetical protein